MDAIVKNIKWDTEDNGEVIDQDDLQLPEETVIENLEDIFDEEIGEVTEEDVVDYLSDTYGYCIFGCDVELTERAAQSVAVSAGC